LTVLFRAPCGSAIPACRLRNGGVLAVSVRLTAGVSGSLLAMVSVQLFAPGSAGVKRTTRSRQEPGGTEAGKGFCTSVKSEHPTDAEATDSGQPPVLQTESVRSAGFHAEATPKSVEPVTWMSGSVPSPETWTATLGLSGSLFAIVSVPDWGPLAVGCKVTWKRKQKSWLIVTGKPEEGAVTANRGFDDAMDETIRSLLPVLQTLSVPVPVAPTQAWPRARLPGTWIWGTSVGVTDRQAVGADEQASLPAGWATAW